MINQEEYEILKDLFHFIHWEDEEMKKDKKWLSEQVGDLNSTDAVFNESGVSYIDTAVSMERVLELINQLDEPESVETEVKSKQELIEKWESAIESAEFYGKGKEERLISYMRDFVDDLNQLDEPEVLSQDLPVIPKFVADYIQEGKELGCDLGTAMTVQTEMLKGIRDYIKNNEETFARAWLDGYEIEKEQLYYIPLGVVRSDGNEFYLAKTSLNVIGIDSSSERYVKDKWNAHYYRFTEQEIKDYDERFWAFAVPVEEVEE